MSILSKARLTHLSAKFEVGRVIKRSVTISSSEVRLRLTLSYLIAKTSCSLFIIVVMVSRVGEVPCFSTVTSTSSFTSGVMLGNQSIIESIQIIVLEISICYCQISYPVVENSLSAISSLSVEKTALDYSVIVLPMCP